MVLTIFAFGGEIDQIDGIDAWLEIRQTLMDAKC